MLKKEELKKYFKTNNFFNRDLNWVEFNRKVLAEALNPEAPLFEKIKFISIFFSNLDEFYMIRVSGLKEQLRANISDPAIDGLTPLQAINSIEKEVIPMLEEIYNLWRDDIVKELDENQIHIQEIKGLKKNEQERLNEYYKKEIYPVLTPLAFDPGRPFPYISNLSLSFALLVKRQSGEKHFARVKIPGILPRLLQIDDIVKDNKKKNNEKMCARFVWIEDLIEQNLSSLFPGMEILESHLFRITRDTDLEIQEDEADDLLEFIEENIKQRKFGSVVRLEVDKDMPNFMLDTLVENLEINNSDIHVINGPLGLSNVISIYNLPFPHLKDKPFHPVLSPSIDEEESIFTAIKKKDILLHHPFESFAPVTKFIKEAVEDPDVLAIKQTLYRVGPNSPIVRLLIEAAERKKQVAVLVELKARFDEENNIFWAKELEKAGVHVVYGLLGLKTHAKMTLVVRKETDNVKRYVHLSTGNYNTTTAKLYTDLGFFTSDEAICSDVSEIFNYLTGYADQSKFRKLLVAPVNMRDKFLQLISREIELHRKHGNGRLIFKMNSMVDPTLIAALYEASCKGVQIDLIVRGVCCLVPQVPNLSDNIRVVSIVGRYLEHSRAFYFHNNGNSEIYLGSADLMPRNLDRRVETIFPIEDKNIKDHIKTILLDYALKDNCKARFLLPTGKYIYNQKVSPEEKVNLQEWLMEFYSNSVRSFQ